MSDIRGFTLIELVMGMVLVGILAVSLWPRSPNTTSLTIDARAQELASDIRYVQTLSMTTGQRYCLTLTPITGPPYSGYSLTTAASTCATTVTHPAGLTQPISMCGGSACLSAAPVLANDYIQFDGLGVPYSAPTTVLGADVKITMNDGGISQSVTISQVTGRVTVP